MVHKQIVTICSIMLTYIFKTEQRVKILYYVLYNDSASVTQVSKETGTNKGLVSGYLNKLRKDSLLQKKDKKYCAIDNAKVRAIKVLLNLDRLGMMPLRSYRILGIGLFGSWAQGKNT